MWFAGVTASGALLIVRADPQVWIREGLLAMLRRGEDVHPAVRLDGDVLTIDAANGRVVYRLRQYLPEEDCWLAEWPD